MRTILAAFATLLSTSFFSQNLDWAYSIGQQSSAQGRNIETDKQGNVYVFGSFGGTVDFDPGSGIDTLGYGTSFVTKSDSSGNLIWARMFLGYASAEAIAIDPWGNVYVTGTLSWYTDFDPSPTSSYTMFPEGSTDPYICKLDASGNFKWVKRWTGDIYDAGTDIECDQFGNVYATGYYGDDFDADPGPGEYNLPTIYFDHYYLIKLDSACNLLFATAVYANDVMYAPKLELDNAGNMYLSGTWRSALWVPGFSQINSNSYSFDYFIIKYNPFGTAQWVKVIGGGSGEYLHSLKVDYAGNVYSAGTNIGGVTDMDPGSATYTVGTSNTADIIISKLNTNGNFVWGLHLPEPTGHETANAIDANDEGVYLAGSFSHTIDFNPGSGTYTVAAPGYESDAFLLKLDTGGVFQWVHAFGGSSVDVSQGVDLHPSGSIHHSGYFNGTVDLDHGVGTQTVNSGTWEDMFVRKLHGPCITPAAPVNLTPANGLTVCSGNSTTLTASSPGDVKWFTSSTGGSPVHTGYQFVTPSLTTNVTYYTEALTCTNSAARTPITVSVLTQPLPTLTPIVSNGTVCSGSAVSFSASGVYSYTWFPVLHTNTIIPSATSVYTVIGSNTTGCTDTKTVQITVNPVPQVTATIIPPLTCPGATVSLFAGGSAQSYTWAGQNVSGTNAIAYYTTIYTVTGTGSNGCTTTQTIELAVEQPPSISLMSNTYSVCPGQTVSTFAYAMTPATYTWSHGLSQFVPFSPSVSTVYTVTGTSSLGCSSTATMGVYVYTVPTVTAAVSPTVICAGQSVTLTSMGTANSYTWSGPAITGNLAYPSSTSVYFLTGKGTGNCLVSDQVTVTVNPLPTVQVTPASTTVCQGDAVTFNATGNGHTYQWTGNINNNVAFAPSGSGTYSVTVTNTLTGCQAGLSANVNVLTLPQVGSTPGNTAVCSGASLRLLGTGANSYTWSGGIVNGVNFTPTITSVYTVTGTSVNNGCKGTHTVLVTVNPLPQVLVTPQNPAVCYGNTLSITASGATTYTWANGPSAATWVFPVTSNGDYTVTGIDNNNCKANAVVSVTVLALPTLTIESSGPVCEGQSFYLSATGASTYTWSTNFVGQAVPVIAAAGTVYSVTGTDYNGCSNTLSILPGVLPAPSISVLAFPTQICTGETSTLNVAGGSTYLWSNGDTTAFTIVSPSSDSSFEVVVTGNNGCTTMDSALVQVSLCTGVIDRIGEDQIQLFPNPTGGVLFVKVNALSASAVLRNALGQEICRLTLSSGQNVADINHVANGIYFMVVETEGGKRSVYKLVKE